MIKYKSNNVIMWCPNCGSKEEILTTTIIQSVKRPSNVINKDSITIFSGCRADCTCRTEMIELDHKFVDICEKLRYLGIKIIDTCAAYTIPHNSSIDPISSDTYCSGAYIVISLDNTHDSLHSKAFTETCSFNDDCAELGTIDIDKDHSTGGICISSAFDLTEGRCSIGFVNKEDVGGDEKLKKCCEISDDRLLRFLNDFIKNIEGD